MSIPNVSNVSVIANLSNTSDLPSVFVRYTDEQLGSMQLFQGYPKPMLQFTAVCCILYMVIGIPGNLVTIFALARCEKVRNATGTFIINLSVSDFLNGCFTLPFAASTFWTQSWPHGELFCELFPASRYSLAAVSLFTVMAITINRYIMIAHPTLYHRIYSRRNQIIMIACIWIVACILIVPSWFEIWGRLGMDTETYLCDVIPNQQGTSPRNLIYYLGFAMPCITIICSYGRIFCVVRNISKKSHGNIQNSRISVIDCSSFEIPPNEEISPDNNNQTNRCVPSGDPTYDESNRINPKSNLSSMAQNICKSMYTTKLNITKRLKPSSKDKRLVSMITAILVAFVICYLPMTIIEVSTTVSTRTPSAYLWSYILRFLTTCLNPIIYVVMSQEYRKAYKEVTKPLSWNMCRVCTK